VGYYVNISEPGETVAHGPFALTRAKDFARIGSQFGGDRVVTREFRGPVVRVYSAGSRLWPVTLDQCSGFSRAELPRALVGELEHTVAMAANPTQYRLGAWAPKPPKARKAKLVHAVFTDPFCLGYVDAALQVEAFENVEGDEPLNKTYGIDGFTIAGLERILADCYDFQDMPYVADAIGHAHELAGRNYWKAVYSADGFWSSDWSPAAREVLTTAAARFPELDIIVGDNKKLYFEEM
jgi:hypothetical protein